MPSPTPLRAPEQDILLHRLGMSLPTMEGWCSPEKATRLFELVLQHRPERSLELGVFGARSFLPLACGHWYNGTGKIIGVDPWEVAYTLQGENAPDNDSWWQALDLWKIYEGAQEVMDRSVPKAYWAFSHTSSAHFASQSAQEPTFDLLHQDSNHSELISLEELTLFRPLMRPGALWIMDDADWPTLQKVQQEMVDTHGFTLIEDHTQWRVYQVPR